MVKEQMLPCPKETPVAATAPWDSATAILFLWASGQSRIGLPIFFLLSLCSQETFLAWTYAKAFPLNLFLPPIALVLSPSHAPLCRTYSLQHYHSNTWHYLWITNSQGKWQWNYKLSCRLGWKWKRNGISKKCALNWTREQVQNEGRANPSSIWSF